MNVYEVIATITNEEEDMIAHIYHHTAGVAINFYSADYGDIAHIEVLPTTIYPATKFSTETAIALATEKAVNAFTFEGNISCPV